MQTTTEAIQHGEDQYHISADSVNAEEKTKVLNHYNTFGIFDRWGNIRLHGKMVHGIYHQGTRFINKIMLLINNQKPVLLSSTIKEDNDILSVDLTNPFMERCNIQENTIHISRSQFVRNGSYYEEIHCKHFGEQECTFELKLFFDGDFEDIFEIRGIKRNVKKNPVHYSYNADSITMRYKGLDKIERETVISFYADSNIWIKDKQVCFTVSLQPQQSVNLSYSIDFKISGDKQRTIDSYADAKKSIKEQLNQTRSLFANIYTSHEQFNHWLNRSKADLLSLLTQTKYGKYPYAGVPWYNTAFGRDGIITAMEILWLAPEIGKDVLRFLAAKQATKEIPEKDAEPGKILHETRNGEMANTGEVPFGQYYGTIDATPLFVMLAGMYYERTGDENFIKELWPNIKAALNWINDYGDIDKDGFVEYQLKAENGLANQGWKDSFDAIMYKDGQLAESPIALCEVQGYVYAAKNYGSTMAKLVGAEEYSGQLIKEAEALKKNFNDKFWDDELNCYVLALDGHKKPCRVVASNAGQCLFTRIVDEDKAKRLADTMVSEEMFSGWGIRTLASKEKKYNPMSYHDGSVWPHDNALIAYGMSLYGYQEHALKVMDALFHASLYMELQRLPELYCGFVRRPDEGPTSYPVACSPQAWSVAVVFLLMQACLKVQVKALEKVIFFDKPKIPQYLEQVFINDLKVEGGVCNLVVHQFKNDIGFNLLQKPKDWEMIIRK